jgi:hypothetical protein
MEVVMDVIERKKVAFDDITNLKIPTLISKSYMLRKKLDQKYPHCKIGCEC